MTDRNDVLYRDGLGDITTRHPELNVTEFNPTGHPQLQYTEKSGVEVVLDLIRSHPSRSITYIALGPLTNLAQAMRADGPTIRDRIGRIVCMGGALDVPGNTSPAAECMTPSHSCLISIDDISLVGSQLLCRSLGSQRAIDQR